MNVLEATFIADNVTAKPWLGGNLLVGHHARTAVVIKITQTVPRTVRVHVAGTMPHAVVVKIPRAMPVLGIVIRAVVRRGFRSGFEIAIARLITGRIARRADRRIRRCAHGRLTGNADGWISRRVARRPVTGLQLRQREQRSAAQNG